MITWISAVGTVTFNDPLLGAANISVSQRISEVKLGVNYRFGSPPSEILITLTCRLRAPLAPGNRRYGDPRSTSPIKTLFATAAN